MHQRFNVRFLHSRSVTLLSLLLFFCVDAWGIISPRYVVRESESLNSRRVGSTSDACQLTGIHQGIGREVICTRTNGQQYTGFVNRMAVARSHRHRRVSTIRVNSGSQVKSSPTLTPSNFSANKGSGHTGPTRNQHILSRPTNRTFIEGVRTGVGQVISGFTDFIGNITSRLRQSRIINSRTGARGNVDLVRMPEVNRAGDKLGSPLCGSYRARDRSPLYFTPQAGCLMTAVAQKWRKSFCPNNAPHCRLVVGDASHGETLPRNWPHRTHRDGRCIDIYLPRRPGGGLSDSAGRQGVNDRHLTQQLINLLVSHGGAPNSGAHHSRVVLYSGSNYANALPYRGHNNHIHVCFPENSRNQKICDDSKFDTKVCPELNSKPNANSTFEQSKPEGQSLSSGAVQ